VVEISSDPVQNPAAICDTLVNQSVLLPEGDNSNQLLVKDDICSNASTCGSERSVNHLNSCSSSETRSSSVDINQIMDENENFENIPASARVLWAERSGEQPLDGGPVRSSRAVEQLEADHLDHAYIRGSYSNDPDLLSWYCLGTC